MDIKIHISDNDKNEMINDMFKFTTVMIFINILRNIFSKEELFNDSLVQLIIFINLSLLIYYIFIKRIVLPSK